MFTRRDILQILSAAGLASLTRGCVDNTAGRQGVAWPRRNFVPSRSETPPNRTATLARHNPRIRAADPAAVLSVGNGNFAFNVDCTGLQSLSRQYTAIPLCTLSHWGWHHMPLPAGLNLADLRLKPYPFHGRDIGYATDDAGQKPLFDYLRANPHRLHLGRVALLLDGQPLAIEQLTNIDQTLDLYTGIITSRFTLAGQPVEVTTCCHGEIDGVGIRLASPLVAQARLAVQLVFPYGSTISNGDGADWNKPDAHQSTLAVERPMPREIAIKRQLDDTAYTVRAGWSEKRPVSITMPAAHTFFFQPQGKADAPFELAIAFDAQSDGRPLYSFDEALASSRASWKKFWDAGAAIDLSDCTDPRAPELERRIVLSQYLTAIHCAGPLPSQETGLLCNSWFGKFHLEMHWWHSVHFVGWNRFALFNRSMPLYAKLLDSARARAKSQGFAGARWPKMTGPDGNDSPSPIGPLLIWQQPHPIYYAELAYRHSPTPETLQAWREVVMETAEFMASFAQWDEFRKQFVLGPSIKTVSENEEPATTFNPTYELTAWRFGLTTAQAWRERLGQPRNHDWDHILLNLAPFPTTPNPETRDSLYLMQEDQDTFGPKWDYEHPAMLGALGVLPGDSTDLVVLPPGGSLRNPRYWHIINPALMANTVKKVRATWDFAKVWGWDFPMAAMTAARAGLPELALDLLLFDSPMNHYLPNGCNFQRDNLPAYFPGNGGLLAAIAMMVGGWDGGPNAPAPGFPSNGQWKIRHEGFEQGL